MEFLLNQGNVDANHKDVNGRTPLSLAAAGGHEADVEMVMNREGVDVNSSDRELNTPLSEAAR